MKTIIEMARKAGLEEMWELTPRFIGRLEAFAAIVRADEREAMVAEAAKKGWAMREQQSWVSLTKEETDSALSKYQSWYEFASHLENILKEKNQ